MLGWLIALGFAFALAGAPTFACYVVAVAMFLATGAGAAASIVNVVPGGAAESAGVRSGDHIVGADGVAVTRFDELPDHVRIAVSAQRPVALDIDRAGTTVQLSVTPDAQGHIGVSASGVRLRLPLPNAIAGAIGAPVSVMAEIVRGRVQALTAPKTVTTLGGPITVFAIVSQRPAAEVAGEMLSSACLGLAPLALLTHGLALARGRRKIAA